MTTRCSAALAALKAFAPHSLTSSAATVRTTPTLLRANNDDDDGDDIDFDAATVAAGANIALRLPGLGAPCDCREFPLPRGFDVDDNPIRARLIQDMAKKWDNGKVLKYYFFRGKDPDGNRLKGDKVGKNMMRQAFKEWEAIGIGIRFKETKRRDKSQIRIGFDWRDGNWSYVGRDILAINKSLPTMNIQNIDLDVAKHEIGHTLGLRHEHQSPFAGIVWDEEAVYEAFRRSDGWSREMTFNNVIRKYSPDQVAGSRWNPNSIMHYSFGPGLILKPSRYSNGVNPTPGFSMSDRRTARRFYPRIENAVALERLLPSENIQSAFAGMPLNVKPGEQKDLIVEPDMTGKYVIRTVGKADTFIVLYQKIWGQFEFMAEDDDSGSDRNAKIETRLVRGRKYELRIRFAAGENPAVVMNRGTSSEN